MFTYIRNVGIVVLLIYVWYVYCNEKDDEKEEEKSSKESTTQEVFVPTKEWKVVKKGQPIPAGLQVRMNLETGITEAKLLDEDDSSSSSQRSLTNIPQSKLEDFTENSKLFKPSDLKNAMKNIKGDDIISPDDLKQITKKYRKYEDLKKELRELDLTPKTDGELLTEIIEELKESANKKQDRMLKLLEDLDFLVHQLDNAIEFTKQNGFNDIIYKNLNSSDTKVKSESLKVFSSLVQNNPAVKVSAVESGSVSILLKLISLDSDENIKLRAITGLSCLLRRFPYAQLKFVENGGITVFSKLFESNNLKIKVKLATLVNDLIIEREHFDPTEQEFQLEKQYSQVNLRNLLLENNWCDALSDLLNVLIVADSNEHDSIEKCLLSIKSIIADCGNRFKRDIFLKLQSRYEQLAKLDEGKDEDVSNSDYFHELSNICADILNYIPNSTTTNYKTEL